MAHLRPSNTFRWQAGCRCCSKRAYTCLIFTDSFGLPDGSDLDPEYWEVTSGSWSIQSFSAIPGSASENEALSIPPNPTAHAHASVTAALQPPPYPSQTSCYVIIKDDMWGGYFLGTDQRWYWRIGQGQSILDEYDPGAFPAFPDPTRVTLCYDATRGVLILNGYTIEHTPRELVRLEEPVADNGGTRAGMGGVSCRIDSFVHNVAGHDDGPEEYIYCPRCQPGLDPCIWCFEGTTPDLLQITLSGLRSTGETLCQQGCDSLNGDYVLPRTGPCSYLKEWDSWPELTCAFGPVDYMSMYCRLQPFTDFTAPGTPTYMGFDIAFGARTAANPLPVSYKFGEWLYLSPVEVNIQLPPYPVVDCKSMLDNQSIPFVTFGPDPGCEWRPSQAIVSVLA